MCRPFQTIAALMGCFAVLCVFSPGPAFAQTLGEKTVTTSGGLQVKFNSGGLGSIRLDTQANGTWQDDRDLISGHYVHAPAYGEDPADSIPVNLYADLSSTKYESYGTSCATGGLRSLRSWCSYSVAKSQNLVFVRVRVKAGVKVDLSSEFNFRTVLNKFYTTQYSLPSGIERTESGFQRMGGLLVALDPYPTASKGLLFTGNSLGFAYEILNLAPGNYWQARLPADLPEGDWSWGGILSPMFQGICQGTLNVVLPAVAANSEFVSEYVFYIVKNPNPALVAMFLTSGTFNTCYSEAAVEMNRTEVALAALELSWHSAAGSYDPQGQVENTKVRAVQAQVSYENLKAVVEDTRIRGRLNPAVLVDTSPGTSTLGAMSGGFTQLDQLVTTLNTEYAKVGTNFSSNQDFNASKAALEQALVQADSLLDSLEASLAAAAADFSSRGWIRPADQAPVGARLLYDEPLQGVPWFSARDTGPDRAQAELSKMKALGMNVITTNPQPFTSDSIHYSVAQADWTAFDALLKPFRGTGLRAIFGVQNTLMATTAEAITARGMSADFLAHDYQTSARQDIPDYENPDFNTINTSDFGALGTYLRANFSDVVWGFDYNNEFVWNQNYSPYAKANFLTYLQERYPTVQSLNLAWDKTYATWTDVGNSFQSVRDVGNGVLGDYAVRDWSHYSAGIAFGRRFWGNIYNGLGSGFPEAVRIGRDPGYVVMGAQDATHRMTDVADAHWSLWGHRFMAAALGAAAGGAPFTNSEFWWGNWSDDYKIEQWFGAAVADQSRAQRSNAETLQWGYGCDQMWNYFLNGCNGFMWFAWNDSGYNNGLVKGNGLLRSSCARLAPVFKEARLLSPIVRGSRNCADMAVFYPNSRQYVLGCEDVPGPFLAMQALNIPHDGITEAQIAAGTLANYDVLLLACGEVLPNSVATTIMSWVSGGGTLISSGRVAVYDELGHARTLMQTASGVTFTSERAESGNLTLSGYNLSLSPVTLPANCTQENLIGRFNAISSKSWNVTLGLGVTVLGTYETSQPAVVEKHFGQGRVITSAVPVDRLILKHATALQTAGTQYTSTLLDVYRWILNHAGVDSVVTIDKWGELKTGSENVQMFIRQDNVDPHKRYLFLLNAGYPIAGVSGGSWYSLPYIGGMVSTHVEIALPIVRIREIMRNVDVSFRIESDKAVLDVELEPYRCYAFELTSDPSGLVPSPISGAKSPLDDTPVALTDAVVTAVFRGPDGQSFAVQDPSTMKGIRVISDAVVNPGDAVTITGSVATVNGERVVQTGVVHVETSGNLIPRPIGMNNRSSAGGADGRQAAVADNAGLATLSVGASNVGCLVTIWGRVTAHGTGPLGCPVFYVDDGSGLADGSGNAGVMCRAVHNAGGVAQPIPALDTYASVTGVMGVTRINNIDVRYLRTVSWTAP